MFLPLGPVLTLGHKRIRKEGQHLRRHQKHHRQELLSAAGLLRQRQGEPGLQCRSPSSCQCSTGMGKKTARASCCFIHALKGLRRPIEFFKALGHQSGVWGALGKFGH